MASYNRVIMMGNLTRDPDHKQLASGQSLCRLSLASNRQFKNKQTGMMVQEVCFVDIDVWGPQADSCNQYLKKGGNVLVEGRLKFDTWQDNEGQKRNKHFIVADRVTFLQAASTVSQGDDLAFGGKQEQNGNNVNAQPSLRQGSGGQASGAPAVNSAAPQEAAPAGGNTNTGEVDFKDKPAFEDDLPF